MPIEIPVTPAGERIVSVNVGPDILIFRTYYASGQDRHWLLDIKDGQGKALISGINLVPNAVNLLRGHGDTLEGYELYVMILAGSAKDLDAPGNGMALVWFNPGEENPFYAGDPVKALTGAKT